MKKIIILQGVPASGKSTYSKKLLKDNPNMVRINMDYLRVMLRNAVYDLEYEELVKETRLHIFKELLKTDYDIVIDSCNVVFELLKTLIDAIPAFDVNVKVVTFEISPEIAKERNLKRGGEVTNDIIDRAHLALEKDNDQVVEYLKQEQVTHEVIHIEK